MKSWLLASPKQASMSVLRLFSHLSPVSYLCGPLCFDTLWYKMAHCGILFGGGLAERKEDPSSSC